MDSVSESSSSTNSDECAELPLKKQKLFGNKAPWLLQHQHLQKKYTYKSQDHISNFSDLSNILKWKQLFHYCVLVISHFLGISGKLLDEIYFKEKEQCFSKLSVSYVNISINVPIICATITTEQNEVIIFD